MRTHSNGLIRSQHRTGSVIVIAAVAMVIFLIALVFSVDVAYMHLARTELRLAVDISARAAAESLSRSQDTATARTAAIDIAAEHSVAGEAFTLPPEDVTFGRVSITSGGISAFVAGESPPNAARISTGRTQGRPDGPVSLFFGQLLGRGDFEPTQTAVAAQLDRDIALVLDRSSSMNSDDKFESLKVAVNVFMDEIIATPQTEHVSITVYDEFADKVIELTPDAAAAASAFSVIETGSGTAIGLGLAMGIDSLLNDAQRRPFADATIILMTDGRHNTGIDPEDAILNAPAHFTVHTITFGDNAEEERMAALAATRNGQHFHAPDNQTLISIFEEIATALPVVLSE